MAKPRRMRSHRSAGGCSMGHARWRAWLRPRGERLQRPCRASSAGGCSVRPACARLPRAGPGLGAACGWRRRCVVAQPASTEQRPGTRPVSECTGLHLNSFFHCRRRQTRRRRRPRCGAMLRARAWTTLGIAGAQEGIDLLSCAMEEGRVGWSRSRRAWQSLLVGAAGPALPGSTARAKRRLRQGVFMGAADAGVAGQGGQPVQRSQHLRRACPRTGGRSRRRTACRRRTAGVRRRRRWPRRRCGRRCGPAHRAPRSAAPSAGHLSPSRSGLKGSGMRSRGRAVDRGAGGLAQFGHAAGVVAVVVRD